eukprot:CAMPEP_0168163806 /NCGR_PEP_ID=MMETSP0139_2-20121125/578_1 /TAXON_ID=44445 /ORGANISM="Pseudo-nitzschia australis, Strain 10249 10 AB" /LENGTH=138 /DNA_ID=CAMNT_0008080737 /DNA_START=103 /DNA_END=520 /DNA_ORIENTATION=+
MNEIIVLNNNAIASLQLGNVCDACNLMTEASNVFLSTQDVQKKKRRRKHRDCTISWTKVKCCDTDPTNGILQGESPIDILMLPRLSNPAVRKSLEPRIFAVRSVKMIPIYVQATLHQSYGTILACVVNYLDWILVTTR